MKRPLLHVSSGGNAKVSCDGRFVRKEVGWSQTCTAVTTAACKQVASVPSDQLDAL